MSWLVVADLGLKSAATFYIFLIIALPPTRQTRIRIMRIVAASLPGTGPRTSTAFDFAPGAAAGLRVLPTRDSAPVADSRDALH